ncbi:transglutaminase domain-containing protein [Dysosmobacter sp.]
MEAYYFQSLTKPQQAAYHAMQEGLSALRPVFSVPRLENRELSDIFFRLRLDRPEIFYATGFSYRFAPGAERAELLPDYLFEKGKILDHQKALSARVEKLTRPAQSMTALEKERYIHDFLCENVRYDKLKKPYSHEIIGPLGQGVGVCEGIAKSVKILCDALGLWCMIAVSQANPEQGIKYRHAWNIVKLEGRFYHLDATFDNSLSQQGLLRYDYFNLDDKRLFRDHQNVLYPVPSCTDTDRFFYKESRLSFTKIEEVCKRAQMPIRKNLPFVFHWRGGYLTPEVLSELVHALEAEARKKGRHAAVSFNPSQAVVLARFPAGLPQGVPVAEVPNEGETA